MEELDILDEKENLWKDYLKKKEENSFAEQIKKIPEKFTENDEEYRNELLDNKFSKWTKKDFTKFLRASEIYGLNDFSNISKFIRTKTPEETEDYSITFQRRNNELPNGHRIMTRLNKFESEKNKIMEYQEILENYFSELIDNYDDIYSNVVIPYKKNKPVKGNKKEKEEQNSGVNKDIDL